MSVVASADDFLILYDDIYRNPAYCEEQIVVNEIKLGKVFPVGSLKMLLIHLHTQCRDTVI